MLTLEWCADDFNFVEIKNHTESVCSCHPMAKSASRSGSSKAHLAVAIIAQRPRICPAQICKPLQRCHKPSVIRQTPLGCKKGVGTQRVALFVSGVQRTKFSIVSATCGRLGDCARLCVFAVVSYQRSQCYRIAPGKQVRHFESRPTSTFVTPQRRKSTLPSHERPSLYADFSSIPEDSKGVVAVVALGMLSVPAYMHTSESQANAQHTDSPPGGE